MGVILLCVGRGRVGRSAYTFSSSFTLVTYTYVVACLLFGGLSRLGSSKETESASCWCWTLGVVGVGCVIFLDIYKAVKRTRNAAPNNRSLGQ
jgi:hypothetical protein